MGEEAGERCSCRVGDLSCLYSFHLKEGVFLICAPSESLSLRTSSKYICMVSCSLWFSSSRTCIRRSAVCQHAIAMKAVENGRRSTAWGYPERLHSREVCINITNLYREREPKAQRRFQRAATPQIVSLAASSGIRHGQSHRIHLK
jgi:hypothetical protein